MKRGVVMKVFHDPSPLAQSLPMAAHADTCPVCGSPRTEIFFRTPPLPVFCNLLWKQRTAAQDTRRAAVALAFCHQCELIYNRNFDPQLLLYDQQYENALHYSPHFQQYAESLARELVEKYDLYQKHIVEIGCGSGEFLATLCRLGDNRGSGYDPSYDAGRASHHDVRVKISAELFSTQNAPADADLICCRHVLEHLADPLSFLLELRHSLGTRDVPVYFEVPNALYMLDELGIWDIIYEHCNYFLPSAISNLFSAVGFEPLEVRTTYGEQFLCLEARPRPLLTEGLPAAKPMQSDVRDKIALFRDGVETKLATCREQLERCHADRERVVVWGAGSKGVTFLNLLECSLSEVAYVVDLNPRKQGRFVGGIGQEIVPPEFLRTYRPQTVLVMNPNYQHEIAAQLDDLGVKSQLLIV